VAPEAEIRVPAKQPQLPHLGIQTGLIRPHQVLSHDHICEGVFRFKTLQKLFPRPREQFLIRIEPEDPSALGLIDCMISCSREIVAPGEVVQVGAELRGYVGGSVSGAGVGDDHLVSDTGNGREDTGQVLLFVSRDQADTEPHRGRV